ncbi:FadR/GntR family transcriptional regulator [Amycolatopsis sp. lyj-109]|uniref:FadR/GntR family transcriptional regulator n=1 Tax=Amycolatopsis sp. lyj-109 TaxID=2789287 RepID=UPI00397D1FCA
MTAASRTSIVRVPKAGEMIAADLRRQIVLGELAKDDVLPSETALMERYGVSRPTLREAFRILESEQLINIRRGARGGARVLVPDSRVAARYAGLLLQYRKASIADVYEARSLVETAAVRTLAAKRTAADLQALTELVETGETLIGNAVGYAEHDADFHELLVKLSGNDTLDVLAGMLFHLIDAHHRAYAATQDDVPAFASAKVVQRAHVKLLDLIQARDADGATEFWRKHLKQVSNYMTRGEVPELIDILS